MTAVSGACGPGNWAPPGGLYHPGAAPQRPVTYIRDIPLKQRHEICRMLDGSHSWVNLAAHLSFSNDDVQSFKRALYRVAGSPTDDMLTMWDYGCHTVTELYHKLYDMKHARCMMVLKDFVDPSLHRLIQDVQGIQPTEEGSGSAETVHPGYSQMPPVQYIPGAWGQPHAPKSSQGSRPSVPLEATQVSWHGGESVGKSQQQTSDGNHAYHQKQQHLQQQQQQHGRPGQAAGGEGLTVNIDKGSSEKVIGLGSPFKGWPGEKGEGALSLSTAGSSSGNYHKSSSGNKGELASGNGSSGPGMSVQSKKLGEKEKLENYQNQSALSLLMHFNYDEIIQATNNFNITSKLGEGSFGTVYHAVIKMTHYAVKKLKQNDYMGFETNKIARADQMKELRALVTYRNPYIVALCAYCFDGPSPCLVYEFMENGSLEDNLLCKALKDPPDWRTRHKVARGAALGINFLHKAQDQPLIHGDIKSANILLDRHMEPKIADFGLARFGPEDGKSYCYLQTQNAHGTLPYLPEEFKRNFKLSTKVDVYSFGVVLLEILAGERVADNRREPNRLLTDIVDEALELEEPEAVIEKIRDRRCPDWPWDIAGRVLDLARKCTTVKFTQRPEIDEAVKTLTNIAAEIARRDEMQKQREEFSVQNSHRWSPQYYPDSYGPHQRYSGQEVASRYPMAGGGLNRVSLQRNWSAESGSLGMGPGMVPGPRTECGNPGPRRAQSYDPPGRYPYDGPPAGFEPSLRRYTSSETSDENNEKLIDSLSSMTSYDMSSRLSDPSMCAPLLYQSQPSVPSAMSYGQQQGAPYGAQFYDPRQPTYAGQEGGGYRAQTGQQRYPLQHGQYRQPVPAGGERQPRPEPRHQGPEVGFHPAQHLAPAPRVSEGCIRADQSLEDHIKRLDISQLPTKPIGGPLPAAAPSATAEASFRQLGPPAVPGRQPEQNTDIIPGYPAGLKEKSVRPPPPAATVSAISEEEEEGEDGSPLRASLTTAEMRHFLDSSRPREPSQQTERLQGPGTGCLTAGRPSEQGESGQDAAQSSLTTVQMREFLSGRREPTEATEESGTEKLDRALSLAAAARQGKTAGQLAAPPKAAGTACEEPATLTTTTTTTTTTTSTTNAHEDDDPQVSLTTTQMRRFQSGQRRGPAEGSCAESGALARPASGAGLPSATGRPPAPGNTAPLRVKAEEEAEVCCSAPANMAAP